LVFRKPIEDERVVNAIGKQWHVDVSDTTMFQIES